MHRFVILALTLVVVLSGLVVGGRALLAQEATPVDCPTTTPEENKALMQQYFDDYNQRNPENVEDMLADTYVEHNTAMPQTYVEGNDDEIVFWSPDPAYDFTVEVLAMVAEGDMVATRVESTGTFRKDTITGYHPDGRAVQYESHAFWRIECGKVAEGWIVTDIFTIRQQEGIITDEELSDADEPTVATPDLS
jgi:predicted ester cyclase